MVETIRLESGHTLTGIVGSNPTLSARFRPSFVFSVVAQLLSEVRHDLCETSAPSAVKTSFFPLETPLSDRWEILFTWPRMLPTCPLWEI